MKMSFQSSGKFLKKTPSYVNVMHPEKQPKASRGKKRTRNKVENPENVRAQVGRAIFHEDTEQEDQSGTEQQDYDLYSTADEACAKLSLKKRERKREEKQLKVQTTEANVSQSGTLAELQEEIVGSRKDDVFLKKIPSYVNVTHPEKQPKASLVGKQTRNVVENPETVRAQVGQAITRVDTVQEEQSGTEQEDNDKYSTTNEACAKLSLEKRERKYEEMQLKVQSTEDNVSQSETLAELQEENVGSRKDDVENEITIKKSSSRTIPQCVNAEPQSLMERTDKDLSPPFENSKEEQNGENQAETTTEVPTVSTDARPAGGEDSHMALSGSTYYAICDYEKESEDEVTLREGAPVEVLEESEGGWWRVRTQSLSVGWAPSNYLESLICGIQEDQPSFKFKISGLKKCSIKPTRPPKTRHVKRMAKECEEENTWVYYQQKQQQYERKKEVIDLAVDELPYRDTEEVSSCSLAENHEIGKSEESIKRKHNIPRRKKKAEKPVDSPSDLQNGDGTLQYDGHNKYFCDPESGVCRRVPAQRNDIKINKSSAVSVKDIRADKEFQRKEKKIFGEVSKKTNRDEQEHKMLDGNNRGLGCRESDDERGIMNDGSDGEDC